MPTTSFDSFDWLISPLYYNDLSVESKESTQSNGLSTEAVARAFLLTQKTQNAQTFSLLWDDLCVPFSRKPLDLVRLFDSTDTTKHFSMLHIQSNESNESNDLRLKKRIMQYNIIC